MAVTIKDVAKRSNFSVATVSRVVGNYGYVSDETRRKILQVCEELGYKPNVIARSMVKKRTNTLGLIITDIRNPFYIDLIDAVEAYANSKAYSILLYNTNENIDKEISAVNVLVERKVDGILIVPVYQSYDAYTIGKKAKNRNHIDYLINQKIPFVFIDRYIKGIDTDAVVLDNERIAYEATLKLIEKGFNDIVLIGSSPRESSCNERIQGYVRALKDTKTHVNPDNMITSCPTMKDAYSATMSLLEKSLPQAIFALDNMMTLGALKAINRKNLIINKDIFLMGFDDLEIYNDIIPNEIATIYQPVNTMGRLAASILIERIENCIEEKYKMIRLEGNIQI